MNNSENRVINRNDYIAEYEIKDIDLNVSKFGEVESKNGGNNIPPYPGYCLRFDSNNPNAYIETCVLSSDLGKYNVIIKGEGTKEFLYADGSNKFVRIVQYKTIANTDYFNVSYIAFVNLETGNVDHLFECEESRGLILYDARSNQGQFARLHNVASLSSLRTTALTKEYIKDPKNLKDALQAATWSYNTNTSIKDSICNETTFFTLRITPQEDKLIDRYNYVLIGTCPRSSSNTGWLLTKVSSGWYGIDVCHDGVIERAWAIQNSELADGKEHKIAISILPTTVKVQFDDSLTTFNVAATINNIATSHHFGVNHNNSSIKGNFEISNIIKTTYDAFEAGSSNYSVQNYLYGKQPTKANLLDGSIRLYLKNLSPTTNCWLDASINNNNLVPYTQPTAIPVNAPYKCYGTWANNIGSNRSQFNYIRLNDTLGQDTAFTDANGNTVYGFCGAPYNLTASDGTIVSTTIGGRAIPYNASAGTTWKGLGIIQAPYINPETGENDQFAISNANFTADLSGASTACCEYRDPTSDPDCPPEVKHAIDYLQYRTQSSTWEAFHFSNINEIAYRVHARLAYLGYPTDVASKLLFRTSVWVKRLDHPLEGTTEYNNVGQFHCGITSGNGGGVTRKLVDLPKTWTYLSSEFTVTSQVRYYWQWQAGVSASINITDLTKRTSVDPVVSFANPRIELIGVVDPNDASKVYSFGEHYGHHIPKYIEEFSIGDLVL